MEPHIIFGTKEEEHRYDLLSVVMIGLDEESYRKKKTALHGFLGTIFSEELKPSEKLQSLEKDYGMKTTGEIREGVGRMCNLSDGIYERGMEQGKEQNMIELVCRKVSKGKSLDTIAAELEEDKDVVLPIYTAVLKSAPDYDINEVYEYLHHK